MSPVGEDGYHRVGAWRQSLDHELRLAATQMDDASNSCGNCVAQWSDGAVYEQMMVCSARSLLVRGRNLYSGGTEHDANVTTVDDCPVSRFDYLHPGRALPTGTRNRSEERAPAETSPPSHDDPDGAAGDLAKSATANRVSVNRQQSPPLCKLRPTRRVPLPPLVPHLLQSTRSSSRCSSSSSRARLLRGKSR